MEFFKDLFANKILTDTRLHPILTFSLPFHHHPSSTTFGLFPPTSETWLQLSYYVLLQIPIQCAFAFLIYTTIIPHRGTTKAYLIGWGFIIPLSCGMPFWILECLDVRNKVVKLAGGNIMSIVGFRCVEAMYGTPPSPVVEASLSNYVAYYNTLVPFVWDEKTQARKRVTAGEILRTVVWLVFVFHAYSLLLSFMIHHHFKPFPNDHVELDQFHLTLDLFTPQHFANGYLLAVLTYLNLSLGFGATALGNKLQGHSTVPIFRNPLFASRTPTEFWTRRWNVMIHLMMKYGVFRPMRRMVGGSVAVVVAFVVSGLFHEYAWAIDFYPNGCTTVDDGSDGIGFFEDGVWHRCHRPIIGRMTAFFVFTGVVMLLERPVLKLLPSVVVSVLRMLPTFVVSTMLVLVHVPFSHWYYGDWVEGGYFQEFSFALWHIRKISE